MKKILFAGSFDPITKAHLDIIKRLSNLEYKVYVAVLDNSSKKSYFSIEDRLNMIKIATSNLPHIEVLASNELLIDVCKKYEIRVVARGLRNFQDYEYEKQMEYNNKILSKDLEYIYITTKEEYVHISSSVVRELLKYNEVVEHLLSEEVSNYINKLD